MKHAWENSDRSAHPFLCSLCIRKNHFYVIIFINLANSSWQYETACGSVWVHVKKKATDITKTAWQHIRLSLLLTKQIRDKSCTYCIISATFFSPFTHTNTNTHRRKKTLELNSIRFCDDKQTVPTKMGLSLLLSTLLYWNNTHLPNGQTISQV